MNWFRVSTMVPRSGVAGQREPLLSNSRPSVTPLPATVIHSLGLFRSPTASTVIVTEVSAKRRLVKSWTRTSRPDGEPRLPDDVDTNTAPWQLSGVPSALPSGTRPVEISHASGNPLRLQSVWQLSGTPLASTSLLVPAEMSHASGSPLPLQSGRASHESPWPSLSQSACDGLATSGQLSWQSGFPSLSWSGAVPQLSQTFAGQPLHAMAPASFGQASLASGTPSPSLSGVTVMLPPPPACCKIAPVTPSRTVTWPPKLTVNVGSVFATTKCAHHTPYCALPLLPRFSRVPMMPTSGSAKLSGNVGGLMNHPAFGGTVVATVPDQLVKLPSASVDADA